MEKTQKRARTGVVLAIIVAAVVVLGALALFVPMCGGDEPQHVYVDADDTADSVYAKVADDSGAVGAVAFRMLGAATGYSKHVRTGRYAIDGSGALQTFRRFRNGQQEPVALTIPSVRTLDRLAEEIGKRLMLPADTLLAALTDETVCERYGLDTLTVSTLFVPETYDVYWNIGLDKFLNRMKRERDRFWTPERRGKAAAAQLTEEQVVTLASIVDEETANDREKPMVAGMYINRLRAGMPLQADPTIKYAWRRFDLKRIYRNLLTIDSPFNTYRNTGLPPGPIRIPTIAGVDAVLNHVHHNYMYMCAKEDFSGTHNFAVTYAEHLQNAKRYSEALNERGIK